MKRLHTYLLTALFVWCAVLADGQGRVRIAGLETNPEYRALVAEEENLARTLDSVSRSMNEVRAAFRTDTTNRGVLSETILQMEEEMFDIRNRQARLVGQINSIEQDWILQSLNQRGEVVEKVDSVGIADDGPMVANLVYNSYFDRNLTEAECQDLRNAQEIESAIPLLVAEYRENNGRLGVLSATYNSAQTAPIADSIKMRFDSLVRQNEDIDRRIALDWNSVFDNKSYIYNLLADKNNRTGLLEQYSRDFEIVRSEEAKWLGRWASNAITTYTLQKRLITEYEIMLAGELGNESAVDSLKKVQATLPLIAELGLEQVTPIKERLFLDYENIAQHSSVQYNSVNPIPEVKVYPRGVIYRVLLGEFSTRQQPSIFRNVAPLAVERSSEGRYRYFAGGFPSDSTVRAAIVQMRKVGFRKPRPVVWMDGIYVSLGEDEHEPQTEKRFFRVELSGVGELSAEVKELIGTVTGGVDILRAGDVFVVGPLDDALLALRLRTALDGRESELGIKVTEISE